ncbi:hypothetical protein [Mycolicibacterium porcinum]
MLAKPRTSFADWRDFLAMRVDINSPTPVTFVPRLNLQLGKVSREAWWEPDSVTNADGTSVSRRRLVLGTAEQDAGAHVGPKPDRFYEELMQGEWGFGLTGDLTYNGPPPFEQGVTQYPKNGHLALIRQFAFEVLSTADRFNWPQPQAGTTLPP